MLATLYLLFLRKGGGFRMAAALCPFEDFISFYYFFHSILTVLQEHTDTHDSVLGVCSQGSYVELRIKPQIIACRLFSELSVSCITFLSPLPFSFVSLWEASFMVQEITMMILDQHGYWFKVSPGRASQLLRLVWDLIVPGSLEIGPRMMPGTVSSSMAGPMSTARSPGGSPLYWVE